MDKLERIGITALGAALFSWLGVVAVPFLLLVALQIIDYATGLCAAKYRSEPISSYKSMKGIVKKVCCWLLVFVGGVMDWLISFAVDRAGIDISVSFVVACIVCVWLMCNEVISILENMADIGVELPPFLMALAKHIKAKSESRGDVTAPEDDDK